MKLTVKMPVQSNLLYRRFALISALSITEILIAVLASSANASGAQRNCQAIFDLSVVTSPSSVTGALPASGLGKITNPLLNRSGLDHGAFDYHRVSAADFSEAIEQNLKTANANLDRIRADQTAPTFVNTIVQFRSALSDLEQTESIMTHLQSVKMTSELRELEDRFIPRLTEFENSLFFDREIFKRVEVVYRDRNNLNLNAEQLMLVESTYRRFIKDGINLTTEQKARLSKIDVRIAELSELFKNNVSGSASSQSYHLTAPDEVAGLPAQLQKEARDLAAKRGQTGYLFLDQNLFSLISFADNRSVREKAWRLQMGIAQGGGFDNRPVLFEIVKLREERAKILGFETHGHYMIDGRMAGTPEAAQSFLKQLAETYRPAAEKELAELKSFAGTELEPWDVPYFSAKLAEKKFGFREADMKPYFPIDQVLQGAFGVAKRLYGVSFRLRADLPAWDRSVQVYEVHDRDGKYLALFYFDPYHREGKRDGAWMRSIVEAGVVNGQMQRPHVVNVENFPAPNGADPVLLTPEEVTTLFHELGHGLHGMLSRVNNPSLAGTNVAWDFVELPSQFNENWAFEPEVLTTYARHYKTGEPIPDELLARFKASRTYQAGYIGLKQVQTAMLDFAWHAQDLSELKQSSDVEEWELKARAPYQLVAAQGGLLSPWFSHIFSGGYSGGYYSYKWSEILAADAFGVFQASGIFNGATADRFRTSILEKGGTENAAALYRNFRGGDPDPQALLRKEGLVP